MTTDPFAHDDAAYVLGALGYADRVAFEEHLNICADCTRRVAEVAALPRLMAGVSAADLDSAAVDIGEQPPATLLPALMRSVATHRRRRHQVSAALAAVAAACLIALVATLVWPSTHTTTPGRGTASTARAMTAVAPSPVRASMTIVNVAWGSEIHLTCRYDAAYATAADYNLVVVDRHGVTHSAGSWTLVPGVAVNFTAGTAVPAGQIAEVDVTVGSTPILRLTP